MIETWGCLYKKHFLETLATWLFLTQFDSHWLCFLFHWEFPHIFPSISSYLPASKLVYLSFPPIIIVSQLLEGQPLLLLFRHLCPTLCDSVGTLSPGVFSNSCPLSRWCHPAISSSLISFSSCPQSFRTPRSFLMSWLFTSGGQSIGASASVSMLPMNILGWFPLWLTGLFSLLSRGLSRAFSSTTVTLFLTASAETVLQPHSSAS